MRIEDFNLANSALEVKASGCVDVSRDLNLPEGKSIAELLYDSENNEATQKKNNNQKS
jgi:hypothetical protein